MRRSKFKEPKIVLVFNGARVLFAIVRSLHSASEFSGCNLQAISFSCTGKYVSTGGYYYRHVHPDVEIETNDLDNLTLEEYDKMCGYERKYHTAKQMAKKRKSFKQKRKSNKRKDNGEDKEQQDPV
jgi:hypothetical protein